MKKLNLRSGNMSGARTPAVCITGLTASNRIADVATSNPTITTFMKIEEMEPDDTENGLTKNKRTRNRDIPKRVHEYFVFSLYCEI